MQVVVDVGFGEGCLRGSSEYGTLRHVKMAKEGEIKVVMIKIQSEVKC